MLHRWLAWLGTLAPGLALAGLLAWIGAILADFVGQTLLGFDKTPVSAILVTILLGLLVRNIAGLPVAFESGLRFAVKRILRFGIALLGLRLSLVAVGQIGASALPVVLACIVAALILVTWLGRLLGLPPRLASLIAVGTSICGASAIVATGPAIEAEEDEVSYAVACITLFGMTALLAYPYLAHRLFAGNAEQVGIFLGTAIHDTSQVAGAGLMYQQHYDAPMALDIAATTKLVRNVCMGAVIPLMAILYHRRNTAAQSVEAGHLKWHQYVPLFVVAFVALAAVRTIGDLGPKAFGVIPQTAWQEFISSAKSVSVACLTIAMGAVGLGSSVTQLKVLGWRPLLAGLTAALLVGGVSLCLIKLSAVVW
jgi:uncharacterized integral membrane protein (TIGR00698 family)